MAETITRELMYQFASKQVQSETANGENKGPLPLANSTPKMEGCSIIHIRRVFKTVRSHKLFM